MAKMSLSDARRIIRAFNMIFKGTKGDATAATIFQNAVGGKGEFSKLEKSINNLDKDFINGDIGYATPEDKNTAQMKKTYNELYDTYKKKGQFVQNVVTPAVTGTLRTGGNLYGIYNSGLAALLANSAKGLNHSAVTDNLREGAAGLASIFATRGAFGAALGNGVADTIQDIADKYAADDEVANRQAYATANNGASGTMYYNLNRGVSNE